MGTIGQDRFEVRIAGYRVIRRLGAGSHSELYLGHAGEEGANGGASVVIKVFRPSTDHDLISDQVAVLTRASPGSFARLVDVATLPGGSLALVTERLAGPALPAVLDTRARIGPGEAVTILAPVVVALASLHAAGFAHTTLSLAAVRFQAGGRPYVTGLGGLRRLPGFGGRHGADAGEAADGANRLDLVRADYARLALLMRSVFDSVAPTDAAVRRAGALLAWFEMSATAVPFQPSLEELERRLFTWSPALAVRFTETPGESATAVPARLDTSPAPGGAQGASRSAADPPEGSRTSGRPSPLLRLSAVFEGNPPRRLVGRVRTLAAVRRGPLIVLSCVGTAATVLALTFLPPTSTADPGARTTSGRTGETSVPVPSAGSAPSPAGSPGEAAAPTLNGAIAGDDPVRAAKALLAGRLGCLAAASVACLGAFDQAASAIMDADSYAIGHPGVRPAFPFAPEDVGDLRERTGGLAIVELRRGSTSDAGDSEPASLLVVKGEAGWRLRQVFE